MNRLVVVLLSMAACHRSGLMMAGGTGVSITGMVIATQDDLSPAAKPVGATLAVAGGLLLLAGAIEWMLRDAYKID